MKDANETLNNHFELMHKNIRKQKNYKYTM